MQASSVGTNKCMILPRHVKAEWIVSQGLLLGGVPRQTLANDHMLIGKLSKNVAATVSVK